MADLRDVIKTAQSSASLRQNVSQQPADAYPKKNYLTTPKEGTWEVFGKKLPDLGITETMRALLGLPVSSVQQSLTNNPLLVQQVQEKDKQRAIGELQKQGVDYNTATYLVTGKNPQQESQNRVQNMSQQFKSGQLKDQGGKVITNPNDVSTLKHERAMGANVGDIRDFGGVKWRWNGEVWEQLSQPTPNNQRSPQDIANEVATKAKQEGIEGLIDDSTMMKIIEDVRERGLSVADAIERRARETAEERWRLINENLQRQKEETKTVAKRQRELTKQEEDFYRKQIEGRKAAELETITKQREASERELLQQKDDLGRAFQDTSRKLQATLRASGVSSSGFAVGEETKLLRDFNRNLDIIVVKHKDILDELDTAYRETERTYNDKIGELELTTRRILSDIDAWERQQIANIQANENLNLADKLERIQAAINQADQVRLQVETNYANQKLNWAQWMKELQVRMALAAQYAAQDRIDNAYKQLQITRQIQQDALANIPFAKKKIDQYGNVYFESPTYAGWIPIGPYTEDEAKRISEKKMEAPKNIYEQILQGQILSGGGGGGSW